MTAAAVDLEKASDWLNLSDDQIAGIIERPAAAAAVQADASAQIAESAAPGQVALTPAEIAADKAVAAPDAAVEAQKLVPAEAAKPVEVAKPEPEKPAYVPITKFSLKDSEGDLDEADASQSLRLSFNANHKDYTDVPLDKVVKWAQMGLYNEEREQNVLAARQFVSEAQTAIAEKDQTIQQFDEYTKRLLTDPAYLAEVQKTFQAENAPEVRAARAERQLAEFQQQNALSTEDQQIAGFVETQLTPTIGKLTEENPEVRFDEIIGRFTVLTAPLLNRGRIPQHALPEVKRLIDNELAPWVESQNDERAKAKTVQVRKVEAAQTQTALAKRTIARRVAPPTSSAPAQAKSKKFNSAKDWLNDAFPVNYDD